MALARPAERAPEGRHTLRDDSKDRLRLVPPEETTQREHEESVVQLESKIKAVREGMRVLFDKGFKKEAVELGSDLFKIEQAKDQLERFDFEGFRAQVEDLQLSLTVLKGDVEYILKKQGSLPEGEEETTAVNGPGKVTAVSEAPYRQADTAIIHLDKLPGRSKKREFEPHRGAVIDIPAPLVKEIIRESGERNNLIRAIVFGEKENARAICHDLLENRSTFSVEGGRTELELKLEKVLAPQGFTLEQFQDKWKGGLYEAVLKIYQDRADAEIRKQAVAEISTADKLKLNWKGIAKKALLIGGITAATATGFGVVFGGAAAIGAGVATGGVFSRFAQRLAGKRREEGVKSADEKAVQDKMNALIEKKKGDMAEKLAKEWESDEASMSLVLSQSIREASAGNENINQTIVQDSLFKTAEKLKTEGEVNEAQAKELEGLIAGLGNLRETDPELKKLIANAESTPVAIEVLKKLQEAKSGQLFIAEKGEKRKSKIENAAGYLAPVAVGVAVGLAYTSSVGIGARAGMGAFGMGVAGYKLGESRDRAAKEKQVEAEINRMITETDEAINQYKTQKPPAEWTKDELKAAKMSISKLKGLMEVFSGFRGDNPKSLLETKAEAVIYEGDRIIRETEKTKVLLDELKKQREEIVAHASAGIKRVNKEGGQWRRWVGLAAGAVLGGGIGFLGGEWAEHRQEVKMEEKLDELLHDVPAGVKDRALQSFAAPGHKVHDVEDLTFAELKRLSVGDGKALDVGLIQLKITEAQGQEDLLHNYGLKPAELESLSLPDRVAALQDMAKTFGGWEKQGLDKDAIAAIGATGHGAKGPEADTVNSLLAWNKAHGGHTAVVRMLNREIPVADAADVTKVLEHAVRLKDSITGWEKSGLSADSIEAITRADAKNFGLVDQLLERGGDHKAIIAKLINNGLGKGGVELDEVLKGVGGVESRIAGWTEQGLSAQAIDAIDRISVDGVAGKVAMIDRLLSGAGGDPDAMRTINAQLEGGIDIETTIRSALVAQGRGANSVTALIARQLEASPSHYGFDAQKRFTDATEWAQNKAAQLAIAGGYMNKDGTSHLGVVLQGKKDNLVILTDDGDGHLGIKVTGKTYVMDESNVPAAKHAAEILSAAKSSRANIRGLSGALAEGDNKAGNAADVAQAQAESAVRAESDVDKDLIRQMLVNTEARVTKLTAALHHEFLGDKFYKAGTVVRYPETPNGTDESAFRQQLDDGLVALKRLIAEYNKEPIDNLAKEINSKMTAIAEECNLSPDDLYSAKILRTFSNPSAVAQR